MLTVLIWHGINVDPSSFGFDSGLSMAQTGYLTYISNSFEVVMTLPKTITLLVLLVALALVGCAAPHPPQRVDLQPDFYPEEGATNTSTYVDSETAETKVVYDLNGYWKVWLGYADAVAIIQIDDRFEGRTVLGGGCCSHEYEARRLIIRGRVDGNLIHCEKRTAGNDWQASVTELSENGEDFYCLGFPSRHFERLGPTEAYYPLMRNR